MGHASAPSCIRNDVSVGHIRKLRGKSFVVTLTIFYAYIHCEYSIIFNHYKNTKTLKKILRFSKRWRTFFRMYIWISCANPRWGTNYVFVLLHFFADLVVSTSISNLLFCCPYWVIAWENPSVRIICLKLSTMVRSDYFSLKAEDFFNLYSFISKVWLWKWDAKVRGCSSM